jgi:hypothetical protein
MVRLRALHTSDGLGGMCLRGVRSRRQHRIGETRVLACISLLQPLEECISGTLEIKISVRLIIGGLITSGE